LTNNGTIIGEIQVLGFAAAPKVPMDRQRWPPAPNPATAWSSKAITSPGRRRPW